MTHIIALTGAAGAGKDSFADLLVPALKARGLTVTRLAFADTLREHLVQLDPLLPSGKSLCQRLDAESGSDPWRGAKDHPVDGPEVRRLMQVYGTDVVRKDFGADTWVRMTAAKAHAANTDVVILTDARFDNEAAIADTCLRIVRDQAAPTRAHVSEAGVSEELVTDVIDNSGTLEQLRFQTEEQAAVIAGAIEPMTPERLLSPDLWEYLHVERGWSQDDLDGVEDTLTKLFEADTLHLVAEAPCTKDEDFTDWLDDLVEALAHVGVNNIEQPYDDDGHPERRLEIATGFQYRNQHYFLGAGLDHEDLAWDRQEFGALTGLQVLKTLLEADRRVDGLIRELTN